MAVLFYYFMLLFHVYSIYLCYLTTLQCLLNQLPSVGLEFIIFLLYLWSSQDVFFAFLVGVYCLGVLVTFTGFLTFVSLGDFRGQGHVKEPSWDNLSIYPDSVIFKKDILPFLSLLASTVPVFFRFLKKQTNKQTENPIMSISLEAGNRR